jgi:hypothetical protein
VSHEHEFELAAAAVDFELTPAERRRLDAAIAGCSECARAAASYRRDATMLTALPVLDASPSVRRNVERAAGLRPQRTTWTWALLAAVLLGLLLTSAAVIGALDRQRRNDLSQVAPTPQASETPGPTTTPSVPPPDVIALDPPSGELADVGPPLAHDSAALVVTDDLRIRSAPFVGDLSVRYRRLLQRDDRLFVVDGPVIAQNYEWYQVKAWRPSSPDVSWPVGWVARAGHNGEVWFRASTMSCPASPVEAPDLLALAQLERVACYRDKPIEVRAVVGGPPDDTCDPARSGCPTGPPLLTGASLLAGVSATGAPSAAISFAVDPGANVAVADLARAGVVRLRGAFDHPDSASCRPDPARTGPDGPISPSDAVLACRSRFIVTHATIEPFPRLEDVASRTVSDRLRVRSLPEISDASIRYEPLLPLGTEVRVLDGPVLGSGYVWYRVETPVTDPTGHVLSGWVAAAGKDGERWLDVKASGS